MSPGEQPRDEHQVGITNAQEANPDPEISRLTREMNRLFAAQQYSEAVRVALAITAMSKGELRQTFEQHGVRIVHLDHEAFGIYAGIVEPKCRRTSFSCRSYEHRKIRSTDCRSLECKGEGGRPIRRPRRVARAVC